MLRRKREDYVVYVCPICDTTLVKVDKEKVVSYTSCEHYEVKKYTKPYPPEYSDNWWFGKLVHYDENEAYMIVEKLPMLIDHLVTHLGFDLVKYENYNDRTLSITARDYENRTHYFEIDLELLKRLADRIIRELS